MSGFESSYAPTPVHWQRMRLAYLSIETGHITTTWNDATTASIIPRGLTLVQSIHNGTGDAHRSYGERERERERVRTESQIVRTIWWSRISGYNYRVDLLRYRNVKSRVEFDNLQNLYDWYTNTRICFDSRLEGRVVTLADVGNSYTCHRHWPATM